MANYVYNRIICSKETMYKYFIDYNPFNDKKEKFKIHPYITFNKLYNVKDLNEYYIKYGTNIYYGYGFAYREIENNVYEIKFVTLKYYPIMAIIKLFEMDCTAIWYAVEENRIYVSKFFWEENELKEGILYLETEEFYNFQEKTNKIKYSDYDIEVWQYTTMSKRDWKIEKTHNLKERYFNNYPSNLQ